MQKNLVNINIIIGLKMRIKRVIDVFVSLIALTLAAPIFCLIWLFIWIDSGTPILLTQERTGQWNRKFIIYKFRTMYQGATIRINKDGSAQVTNNDDRIIGVGRLLREFGLDELPQLWNVLKGDMSLVGPRPYMPMHTAMLSKWALRRLDMRPGIVCLAEVSGRNYLPWSQRLELDVYYVEHWSIWLDLSILLRTIPVVISRKGVYTLFDSTNRTEKSVDIPEIVQKKKERS
jgi:lipopolysaccharide/colanic/teichoic acid biosynthesis glycosyltransferase